MSHAASSATSAAVAAGCDDGQVPCCDAHCDVMQEIYGIEMEMDQLLTGETSANIETNASLWRHAQARKFQEVNPVEAAATETILNGTRRNG